VGNVPIEMGEMQVHESLRGLLAVLNTDFRVELKTGPPPARKSRGFCFVTFPTHEVAEAAKKILMQSQIQGRSLNISWAENINRVSVWSYFLPDQKKMLPLHDLILA
jgi:RNA recognition motif-containing protein